MNILTNKLFQLIFIILVTTIAYSNTLQNKLVWDDHLFVEQWEAIRSVKNLPELLAGAAPEGQGKLFRPLRSIFYLIDYSLWQTNPFFYHLQALGIHLASTILIYFITLEILKRMQQFNNITIKQSIIPFAASLLFGLHPIHTETIDYVAASMETFGTLFFFASFYLYLRFSNSTTKPRLTRFSNPYFLLSLLFAFLAFFTYEMTLTLPLLIVLYELCFKTQIQNSKFKSQNYNAKFKIKKIGNWIFDIWHLKFKLLPYLSIALFYVFIRFFALGIIARNDYLGYSFYLTQLVMVKVFVRYIGLLIAPFNLTANHLLVGDFPVSMIPYDKLDPILNQSIFDIDVLASIAILLALITTAVFLFKKHPFVSFCIGWFFISLLPVANIIPHGAAMAEKFLYIPSFGFILLLVFIIEKSIALIFDRIQNSKIKSQNYNAKSKIFNFKLQFLTFNFALLIIASIYSYLTFQRNFDWKNDISIFTSMLKYDPNSLIANYTLGIRYGERNQSKEAIQHYTTAIKKAPDFWEAHYNLGNIYAKQNKNDLAITEYKKVMELKPDMIAAKQNYQKLSGSPVIENKNQRHSEFISESQNNKILKQDLYQNGTGQVQDDDNKIASPRNDDNQLSLNDLLALPNDTSSPSQSTTEFQVSFSYPKGWNKQDTNGIVTITNQDKSFTVLIKRDTKTAQASLDQYIQGRTDTYGTLINQGLAKIPNVDIAYVKIWSDKGVSKHQFFLFKENKIVEVIAFPSDSQNMKDFDTIVGSVTF